jgi:RNA polymerase sigma factor (sigma-70 family)
MKASTPVSDLRSDSELLRAIARQDQDAFAELYRRYCNLVYSLAFHSLQNSGLAEEATQDVFIKIWAQPNRWNPNGGKFSSWLLTVTRYTAIDRLRRERPQLDRFILLLETVPDESADGVLWDEAGEGKELHTLMEQLPAEQAQIIQLAFFRGMTHQQMAKALDLPLGTVKTRLRAGLTKLRDYLRDAAQFRIQ